LFNEVPAITRSEKIFGTPRVLDDEFVRCIIAAVVVPGYYRVSAASIAGCWLLERDRCESWVVASAGTTKLDKRIVDLSSETTQEMGGRVLP